MKSQDAEEHRRPGLQSFHRILLPWLLRGTSGPRCGEFIGSPLCKAVTNLVSETLAPPMRFAYRSARKAGRIEPGPSSVAVRGRRCVGDGRDPQRAEGFWIRWKCFTASASTSPMASSWSWSARRAAASRRCCACSPGSRTSPAARSASATRVVNDVPPKERDIAMVFQNYALYPHMTVCENMAFSLTLSEGAEGRDRAARSSRAAEILGLEQLLDRYPRQLSGGQRQRVAMGRAIVRNPQVFLFDEPLSNLDAKLRVQMRAEIKELHQRLKTTTVYVTHDQIEAMTMADKIVVMHDGSIEQIGAPLDLYDTPGQSVRRGLHRLAGDEPARRARVAGRRRCASRRTARDCRCRPTRSRRRGRPGCLRHPARASAARRRRHAGDGAGGRADRLGDAGADAHRRPAGDRRLPRARRLPSPARSCR